MGSFANPNGTADAELQSFILDEMRRHRRSSVVSTNALIRDIRQAMPACPLSTERLAELVAETALLLGIVPVFDRGRLADDHDEPCGARRPMILTLRKTGPGYYTGIDDLK